MPATVQPAAKPVVTSADRPRASVIDAPWYGTVVAQLDTQLIPTPRMTRTADGPLGALGACSWTPQLGRTKPTGFEPASSRFWRPRATTSALRLRPTGILVPPPMREAYWRSSAGPPHARALFGRTPTSFPTVLAWRWAVYGSVHLRSSAAGLRSALRPWSCLNDRERC